MTNVTTPAKDIFSPLLELERMLNRAATRQSVPKVNIVQNDDWTELRIALPGLSKKDIDIKLEDNVLKISSLKEEKELAKDSNFLLKEFDYSNFQLEYKLTENVDTEKIEAKYKNGILVVKLPFKKEEELHQSKKISLK